MTATGRATKDASLGQLVSSVTGHVSALVRLEIELAKAELQQQLQQGAVGGGLAAFAILLVVLAIVLFSIAAALGLAYVMPTWAAFLVVGGVYVLIAAVLIFVSMRKFKAIKGPERAAAALAETKETLTQRSQLRSDARAAGISAAELNASNDSTL
jgi:Putative Actinobacterial Holin-X, holin superfamily III